MTMTVGCVFGIATEVFAKARISADGAVNLTPVLLREWVVDRRRKDERVVEVVKERQGIADEMDVRFELPRLGRMSVLAREAVALRASAIRWIDRAKATDQSLGQCALGNLVRRM